MDKEIKVFEPAMCCPSGMCGPTPDKKVIDFNDLIKRVEAEGYTVKRFTITRDAAAFQSEAQVMAVIKDEQSEALPITTLGGEIIKKGGYPTYEEIVGSSA
jgi:hypothetical protein